MSGDALISFGIAFVGLGGVLLGGLINLGAQRVDRTDKRDYELRSHVAEVLSASLTYEASLKQTLNRKEAKVPKAAVDRIVEDLNEASRTLIKKSILLNITSHPPLSEFALALHNTVATTTGYFHPAVVSGSSENLSDKDYHFKRLELHREALAAVARVKPVFRQSAAVIEKRKIDTFEFKNGKSSPNEV